MGDDSLLSLSEHEGDHGEIVPTGPSGGSVLFRGPVGDWLLDVRCEVNSATRLARWTFQTLDPKTGLPPPASAEGFLPPNDDSHRGEGHVEFTVTPQEGTADGTEITNQATITFDDQKEIQTNVKRNTFRTSLGPEVPHNPIPPDRIAPTVDVNFLTWQSAAEEYGVSLWEEGAVEPAPKKAAGRSFATAGALKPGTTYSWKVTARNGASEVAGPVWSFRTLDLAVKFRRGEATADGSLDLSDPISILSYLFLGSAAPSCLKSADVDDNGSVEITDAVSLLYFLFLGGDRPPPPFDACGADPTADALTCGSFAPCKG